MQPILSTNLSLKYNLTIKTSVELTKKMLQKLSQDYTGCHRFIPKNGCTFYVIPIKNTYPQLLTNEPEKSFSSKLLGTSMRFVSI